MPPGATRGVRDKGFWETALPERSAVQVDVERAISLRHQETRRKQVLEGNDMVPCGCVLSPLVGSPGGAGGICATSNALWLCRGEKGRPDSTPPPPRPPPTWDPALGGARHP